MTKIEMEKEIARLERKVKKLEKKLVENECCSCTKLDAADYIVAYGDIGGDLRLTYANQKRRG